MGSRKIIIGSFILFLIIISVLVAVVFLPRSKTKSIVSFNTWYNIYQKPEIKKTSSKKSSLKIVESPPMLIDKIYRSMQGPSAASEIYLDDSFFGRIKSFYQPELIWLTGYSIELFDDKGNKISYDFMCHNNLNISVKNILPWKVNSIGTDTRLFTLTEGQTNVELPNGFGIPVMSDQPLRVDFQVLNHNIENANIKVIQRVTIKYRKDKDLSGKMKALFQQSAFITKQITGPKGEYNEEPVNDSAISSQNKTNEPKTCCGNTFADEGGNYNPFYDKYKREYTGHWIIDDSVEVLKTDVTQMLNLLSDTKAHFFSVHVHPFCESLELIDVTDKKSLYKASTINFTDKIGLENIDSKVDLPGVPILKCHKYQLVSIYKKNSPVKHTAMATMFLYLEEK